MAVERMGKMDIKNIELVWPNKYGEDGKLCPVEKNGPYPFQIVEGINSPRIGTANRNGQLSLYDLWTGKTGGNSFEAGWKNKLIWGENKLVLTSLLERFAGKINLIYIDPPFATGADFKLRLAVGEKDDEILKEQSILEEKAYRDTWGKGAESYIEMIYDRLLIMRDLLAPNGTIYVHCDWRVNSYIRLIMDELFGKDNFRNEIVWCYSGGGIPTMDFPRKHDTIFRYSKSSDYVYNFIPKPYSEGTIQRGRTQVKGENAKLREEGTPVTDWWTDIKAIHSPTDYEKLDYPTQKSEELLERIIKASSNEGDLVADFFSGSGTTIAVAEKLKRRWIACDLSRYAIHLTRKRLLELENSPDLNDKTKPYNNKAKPFEILNIGRFERQLWQMKAFNYKDEKEVLYEYLAFMLKLYGAEPLSGLKNIHGKKNSALVYVGAVDSPVTIQEIVDSIQECKSLKQNELHILGWEWEMGLNEAIQDIAMKEGIRLKLRLIPNEVLEKQAVKNGDVRFFELAYFKCDTNGKTLSSGETIKGPSKISIKLTDFVIPHTDLISEELKKHIRKWSDWIDYWAVDFNFNNDTFHNSWASY